MPTYTHAPAAVDVLVGKVMEKYHGPLHEEGVTVAVLMVGPTTDANGNSSGPPLKRNGFPCCAIIKATGTKQRAAGLADVILEIDEDRWKQFSEAQQAALVDHELCHLQVAKDKDGQIIRDDQDRPRLRTRPHDAEIGWFDEVVRRHSEAALEWMGFHSLSKRFEQLNLPFMRAVG